MVAQPVTPANVTQALPLDCVLCGDSLDVLSRFPDNCVDSIVCDPPAGINFMNKPFDDDRGGRDAWIAWLAAIMREALRVTKPGGHAFVWALPRTSHWTATALEDSGWQVREKCYHIFGSGFPKSKNLGDGVGSALKPAVEEWILCRKPLSERSLEANYAKWGTGGLAIDQCRVGLEGIEHHRTAGSGAIGTANGIYHSSKEPINRKQIERAEQGFNPRYDPSGRFPSNLLLSHSVFCVPQGTKRVRGNNSKLDDQLKHNGNGSRLFGKDQPYVTTHGYADPDGYEEVEDYLCDPSCPIRLLDEQSGIRKGHKTAVCDNRSQVNGSVALHDTRSLGMRGPENSYNDQGGASRYFSCFPPDIEVPFLYSSKASRSEREKGLDSMEHVCYNEATNQNNGGANHWANTDQSQPTQAEEDTSPQRDITASPSGTLPLNQQEWCSDMSMPGNKPMGQSQKDIKSTTRTTTSKTTDSKTLNSLTHSPTSAFTAAASYEMGNGGNHVASARSSTSLPKTSGISPKKDGLSTEDAETVTLAKSSKTSKSETKGVYNNGSGFSGRTQIDGTWVNTDNPRTPPKNSHPCVKPVSLVSWLCTLITPPGGIILDPFAGSGTTGVCAVKNGFHFILVEQSAEYAAICEARIAHAQQEVTRW